MMGDENSSVVGMSGKKKKRELYDEEGLGFESHPDQDDDGEERDKLETDI